jgi:hypothetical protein
MNEMMYKSHGMCEEGLCKEPTGNLSESDHLSGLSTRVYVCVPFHTVGL